MFSHVIIPIIEARQKTTTFHQRVIALDGLACLNGRVLVELYLNFDCDPNGAIDENIWEVSLN
jgi:Guanine nucleotide exchange factor in Golgi transport N-terminal